ncbi:hypothetical protein [Kineosporia succinea]
MTAPLSDFTKDVHATAAATVSDSSAAATRAKVLIVAAALVALLLAGVLAGLITRSVTDPVRRLVSDLDRWPAATCGAGRRWPGTTRSPRWPAPWARSLT